MKIKLKELKLDVDSDDGANRLPDDYPVRCQECDWKGLLENCPIERESEGWEYPEYGIAVCPECGEGIEY